MSVLIVGSVALDTVETIKGKREETLGGSATFCSLAASSFTGVRLVGVVGSDFPERHVELYRRYKIDLEGLETAEGRTFRWAGKYADDFSTRETLNTELGVFERFDPKLPPNYRRTPFVLLGNIQPDLQARVLDQIEGKPFVVGDTMNLWIDLFPQKVVDLLPRLDVLTINDEEARQLSGKHNLSQAARWILDHGLGVLVIKRGEHGASAFSKDGRQFHLPAYCVDDVADPTGAGDTFAGALTGYMASRKATDFETFKKALVAGTLWASFLVEGFSTDGLLQLSHEDVLRRLAAFQEHTALPEMRLAMPNDTP